MNNRFLIIIFFILAVIVFGLVLRSKKLKGAVFISLLYIVVTAALIGSGGFLLNSRFLVLSDHVAFYLLNGWMFLWGVLNVFLIKKLLRWSRESGFSTGFFFSVVIALIGGILLLLVFQISNYSTFIGIDLTSLLMFILPYIFYGAFSSYLAIPVKILRKWHYPVHEHIEDPLDREMESPLVVGFEFKKKSSDKSMTTFRAKAPKEMVFGKLFYYFINDYNDRNPDEKIEYLNEEKKPIGWIFYFKPRWFRRIRYIDPEETNSFNLIVENSVIICKRVIEK
jgi:hypothetical protein